MRIYLDHNATTPLRPEAREAMQAVLGEDAIGNPSSVHAEGAAARARMETARVRVARLVGAPPAAVTFTSGATEANNTVLLGMLEPGDHVVTTQIEHSSVLEPLAWLEQRGVQVTRLAPDSDGCVASDAVAAALRPTTRLVTMIGASHETGALQPVEAVAALCAARDTLFHVDATQTIGRIAMDLGRLGADFVSFSGHKLGGPQGVGALVAPGRRPAPSLLRGGGQERGRRGGTENVAGLAGFGVACETVREHGAAESEVAGKLCERLWHGLRSAVPGVRRNGHPDRTLRNTLNVEIPGTTGEVLVQALDLEGIAVSAGAACHSGSIEPSPTLLAMGRTPEQARASLRMSLGRGLDEGQIDRVVERVGEVVARVRAEEAP